MIRHLIAGLGLLLVVGLSPLARGADIYVNGQKVRGLTNLTITECTVVFNASGDVFITAPGFQVLETAAQGEQAKENLQPTKALKNRYFLYTFTNAPGRVPCSFIVWVNDHKIKEFDSSVTQLAVELTLYLNAGSNGVKVQSVCTPGQNGNAADSFHIHVGRGRPEAGVLEINQQLLDYSRSGADTASSVDEYQFQAD